MTKSDESWNDRMVVAYHGTDRKSASAIRRSGFNSGTWFALHLEDAIAFGGLSINLFRLGVKNETLPWRKMHSLR